MHSTHTFIRSLQKNLRKDKQDFPVPANGQSSFPTVVHAPEWQTHVSLATLAMCAYHADPNQLPDPGNGPKQSNPQSEQSKPQDAQDLGPGLGSTHEDEDRDNNTKEHELQGDNSSGNIDNRQVNDPTGSTIHDLDRAPPP